MAYMQEPLCCMLRHFTTLILDILFFQGWYPEDLQDKLAVPAMDWGLLLVTLVVLLEKDNFTSLRGITGSAMDKSKVSLITVQQDDTMVTGTCVRKIEFKHCSCCPTEMPDLLFSLWAP